ncbi:trypsin-2-like [Paramacrobiotus metropolitanus]|uniref:trypsin-2-like n=1 Tax=Paramacrobiotus metropolitanus TaxID=2943436 RepID=UPI002445B1BA|nr:trypsin-2-like [Paramacrobiotus metropolitanus]
MQILLGILFGIAAMVASVPTTWSGHKSGLSGEIHTGIVRHADKIVGGTEATPYRWPWQVGIQSRIVAEDPDVLEDPPGFFCGGSVIDKKWILTAGHCCVHMIETRESVEFEVFVGTHRRQDVQSRDIYAVARIFIHPHYSNPETGGANDICLLELEREVTFNQRVQPVRLTHSVWPAGTECWTSGWGSINFMVTTVIQADALQNTPVSLVSENNCRNAYVAAGVYMNIGSHSVCALRAGAGPCRTDSGGPLMCQRGNQWELVGVTSGGSPYGCGHPLFPSLFANVVNFRDWISSTTGIPF